MTKSRNASPTLNGFLFQIDAAVYFMIKYIEEVEKIRVEGTKEDIELELKDKKKIMVQVKSQWDNLENNQNVLANLDSSLKSLSEADSQEVRDLMYVSNLPDPLKNDDIEFTKYPGVTFKKYSELRTSSKDVINNRLSKLFGEDCVKFNKDKLWIIRIPFFGEDNDEKHKFINDMVKEFLADISDKMSVKNFVHFWESKFLRNGSENPRTCITKNEMSNYLILACLDRYDATTDYSKFNVNQDDYEEARNKYSEFIEDKENHYEAICKVNSLYERAVKRKNISHEEFVQKEKIKLYNYFFESDKKNISEFAEDEIIDMLVAQIISYVILKKRNIIKKINEKVFKWS